MLSPNLSISSAALLAFVSLALVNACTANEQKLKFNKAGWTTFDDSDGATYPYRHRMLDDLIQHHQLKALTYKQLVDSIGEPTNYGQDDGTVRYLIFEEFESDIDPVHGKTLDLTLGTDSVVTSCKVSEW